MRCTKLIFRYVILFYHPNKIASCKITYKGIIYKYKYFFNFSASEFYSLKFKHQSSQLN